MLKKIGNPGQLAFKIIIFLKFRNWDINVKNDDKLFDGFLSHGQLLWRMAKVQQ